MISRVGLNIAAPTKRRRTVFVGILGLFALVAAACSVQETNAYPVDIFTEMHYNQSNRNQEPPRLQPPAESVAFESVGGPEVAYNVPEFRRRPYDPVVAGELYAINCAVCHGVNGEGNGPAAAHLTSDQSYWATASEQNPARTTYAEPANLLATRGARTEDIWFVTLQNGVQVMPAFGKQLSEEEIWDIIAYLFDEQTGLGTAQ